MKKTKEVFKFNWEEKYKYYDDEDLVEKKFEEWFDGKFDEDALKFWRVQADYTYTREGDVFTVSVNVETKSDEEVALERKEFMFLLPEIFVFETTIPNYKLEKDVNSISDEFREDIAQAIEKYFKENDIDEWLENVGGIQWFYMPDEPKTLYIKWYIEIGRWDKVKFKKQNLGD